MPFEHHLTANPRRAHNNKWDVQESLYTPAQCQTIKVRTVAWSLDNKYSRR